MTKRFLAPGGAVTALEGVDLEVATGEFVAITGPSGSGKTTLLHVACLLEPPTAGEIEFDGESTARLSERRLAALRGRKIGLVFQKFCLLPHRSVLENVLFRFRYIPHDAQEARRQALAALAAVGLQDRLDHPARLLSGGEMQRVAIARALARPPRLLAADEPTGNLDRAAAGGVMSCLQQLNRSGVTILLVTHNAALLDCAARRLTLRDGRLATDS
ncbi:MAG: ABC transporter ATP-binding protein [Kiritimatiellaeota bacterium]|nr:ABC transporter ATP-binding protein [Kiritimatiellota bacterium]